VRHIGRQQVIADANHVLFFNAADACRVTHPVAGGDRSFVLAPSDELLRELAPPRIFVSGHPPRLRNQHHRIDARSQALAAMLRHGLASGTLEGLAAETLPVALITRILGPQTSYIPRATPAQRRLVNRVKLLLMSDLSKRWTLTEIAFEVRASAVYLTQLFQRVEGMPLYRYHLQLRLARSLDLIPHRDDLASLALELGFSSHAHFTATFRQAYGRTPSALKRLCGC
jgi:AraC family transcriptional regulator